MLPRAGALVVPVFPSQRVGGIAIRSACAGRPRRWGFGEEAVRGSADLIPEVLAGLGPRP